MIEASRPPSTGTTAPVIALLRAGRIIARGSPEALRRQFGVADLAGVYARAMAEEEDASAAGGLP